MNARTEKAWTLGLSVYAVCTLISMAIMSIAAAFLGALLLFYFSELRSGLIALFRRREARVYLAVSLALSLACGLSLVFARLNPVQYGGLSPHVHFGQDLFKLWYLFWPFPLAAALIRMGRDSRARVLRTWLVAFMALSVLGIVQHFTGFPRPQAIPNYPGRFHATLFLGHHLSVASVFIFPFFAGLDFAHRRRLFPRAVFLAGIALGMVTLFLTFSRTLWVALPLGLLVWIAISLPRKAALALLVPLLLGGLAVTQLPSVQQRLHTGIGYGEREDLWEANLAFFKARPLTGVGWRHNEEASAYYLMQKYPGQSVFSGHAHNNLLDMAASCGLPGVLTWLLWSGTVLLFACRARAAGFACAWIAFQVNGLTQVNFWEAKVQHQMMWVVAWTLAWLWLRSETTKDTRSETLVEDNS